MTRSKESSELETQDGQSMAEGYILMYLTCSWIFHFSAHNEQAFYLKQKLDRFFSGITHFFINVWDIFNILGFTYHVAI